MWDGRTNRCTEDELREWLTSWTKRAGAYRSRPGMTIKSVAEALGSSMETLCNQIGADGQRPAVHPLSVSLG